MQKANHEMWAVTGPFIGGHIFQRKLWCSQITMKMFSSQITIDSQGTWCGTYGDPWGTHTKC